MHDKLPIRRHYGNSLALLPQTLSLSYTRINCMHALHALSTSQLLNRKLSTCNHMIPKGGAASCMLSITSTRLACCRIIESSIGLILHAVKFACHKSVSACIIDIIMAQRQSWIHILNCSRSTWGLACSTFTLHLFVARQGDVHIGSPCLHGRVDWSGRLLQSSARGGLERHAVP